VTKTWTVEMKIETKKAKSSCGRFLDQECAIASTSWDLTGCPCLKLLQMVIEGCHKAPVFQRVS
jgi:hypothetical protein